MECFTGYIDLSKRRVSPEDIVKCEERYNKSKMVHSIMRHVAEKTRTPIEELYERIAWPLTKKYGHAVDAFKLSITLVAPESYYDTSNCQTGTQTYGQMPTFPATLYLKN
jgi:translation initiation factor 2 alpha subunit (eIF-2alpha)